MRFVEPKSEIIVQNSGIDGIYELATKCGYICYKTDKEITPESAKKFISALSKSGHGSVLEHGTVYLKTNWDTVKDWKEKVLPIKYDKNHFSKVVYVSGEDNNITAYITTNLRVLVENGWMDDLKYICEPTPYHERRVTVRFWMDRVGSQSCMRHRGENGISFSQESTRYCDYSNEEKFGDGGIKFSIPHWTDEKSINNVLEDTDNWVGTLGLIHKQYLKEIVEEKKTEPIFDKLYYWLAGNDFCEFCYLKLLDSELKAEDARAILPLDINTEFAMTAFVSDWKHFFDLRADGTTGRPHPDINKIAVSLKEDFIKYGYLKDE